MRAHHLALLAALYPAMAFAAPRTADAALLWSASGALDITASIEAPNGCYFAGAAKAGLPEGMPNIEHTLAITLPVNMHGQICPQVITPLNYHLAVPGVPRGTVAIVVYESWPGGHPVRAAAYHVPRHMNRHKRHAPAPEK